MAEHSVFDDTLVSAVLAAQHMVVLTGAGVSAESGIATFRDAMTGLWSQYDPKRLASEAGFISDPALVWGWYEWRRNKVLGAQPNPAHVAIASLEQWVPKLTLITQNVDDLHERAGSNSVLHLHGSLLSPRCIDCARPYSLALDAVTNDTEAQRIEPPHCPVCDAYIRPGVVWFGESLDTKTWHAAADAVEQCDLLMSIGTSGLVHPAASLPLLALQAGAKVVQINTEATSLDAKASYTLQGKAGEVLPALVSAAFKSSTLK